jgi:hypothetical protein
MDHVDIFKVIKDDTSKTTGYCICIGNVGDNLARALWELLQDEKRNDLIKLLKYKNQSGSNWMTINRSLHL